MKATTKSYLFIATVFVAAAVIISFFLPRQTTIGLEFSEGKPWKFEQLTAPFSFAVYKSERALQEERAAVMSAQRPYYVLEESKGDEALGAYEAAYKKELYLLVGPMLNRQINAKLDELYSN